MDSATASVPETLKGGVDGSDDDVEDREGCASSSSAAIAPVADAPPGDDGVDDKARSSAIASS